MTSMQHLEGPFPLRNAASRASRFSSLVWRSPLFDASGYADEARHFLLALEDAGFDVTARPTQWSKRRAHLPPIDETRLMAMASRREPPGAVQVSHTLPTEFARPDSAALNVGRTMFETDALPEHWVAACNRMDRVWVPSEFNRKTFVCAGVEESKLAVVPGAIDVSRYDASAPPPAIDGAREYNFLSVFDWSLRKGWDVLVRAYVEEFDAEEDVALILKVHSSRGYRIDQIAATVSDYIRDCLGRRPDRAPDIVFESSDIPSTRMPLLYRAADCFVLPTRGEGRGRTLMEAMAMALPVIGTNWSGNTAFMAADCSYLLDYTLVPVPECAIREAPAFAGHHWAVPDPTHLRSLMRHVFTCRAEARGVGRRARAHIASRCSYAAVADAICEDLDLALGSSVRNAA